MQAGARPRQSRAAETRMLCVALLAASLVSALGAQDVDWGADVIVCNLGGTSSLLRVATDNDTNGDIYVAVLDTGTTGADTISTWRSSDGGFRWALDSQFAADTSTGPFRDCELIVGHDAGGTWLYHFVLAVGTGSGAGLWLRRARPSSQSVAWVCIARGDTITDIAMDRNCESPEWLFSAWATQGGNICAASSPDSGQTWSNLRVGPRPGRFPALCAGGDGSVYVAGTLLDSSAGWAARYDDNLRGPDVTFRLIDSGAAGRIGMVSLASDRDAPRHLQTSVALYCRSMQVGPELRVVPYYAWTENGGVDWSWNVWPATNQGRTTWAARFPQVRRSYDDPLIRAVVTMDEPSRYWDTLVYAYTYGDPPYVWEGRTTCNDHRASQFVGASVGSSKQTSGGYMVYALHVTNRVYFDAYRFTGVDDSPRPEVVGALVLTGVAPLALELFLECRQQVVVKAVGVAGQSEGVLYEGETGPGRCHLVLPATHLAGGVHFVQVQGETGKWTAKAVIQR